MRTGTTALARKIWKISAEVELDSVAIHKRYFGDFTLIGYGRSRRAFLHNESNIVYKVPKYSSLFGRQDGLNYLEHQNFKTIRNLMIDGLSAPASDIHEWDHNIVISCEFINDESAKCECWAENRCKDKARCWFRWPGAGEINDALDSMGLTDIHSGNVALTGRTWYIIDAGE